TSLHKDETESLARSLASTLGVPPDVPAMGSCADALVPIASASSLWRAPLDLPAPATDVPQDPRAKRYVAHARRGAMIFDLGIAIDIALAIAFFLMILHARTRNASWVFVGTFAIVAELLLLTFARDVIFGRSPGRRLFGIRVVQLGT